MRDIHNNHDSVYKLLFKHREMVQGLLTGFVDEVFIQNFNFTSLELCAGSYVTDDLRECHDDVVWRVRWQGTWVYVYILLEFQSTIDKWMAVRIANYTSLLYQDLIRQKKITKRYKLPPVFPIVLYNGQTPWNASCDVRGCIDSLTPLLDVYQLQQKYFVVDIGRIPPDVLENIHNAAASLVRLERGESRDAIRRVVTDLQEMLQSLKYDALRRDFAIWLHHIVLRKMVPQESSECHNLEEVSTMLAERVASWTEEWKMEGRKEGMQHGIREGRREGMQRGRLEGMQEGRQAGIREGRREGMQEGRQAGMQEGRQEGRQAGKAEGARTLLYDFITERFGTVSPEVTLTLNAIYDVDVLRKLATATLKVDSLNEFTPLLKEHVKSLR